MMAREVTKLAEKRSDVLVLPAASFTEIDLIAVR
jgi:hypothetical protein